MIPRGRIIIFSDLVKTSVKPGQNASRSLEDESFQFRKFH